MQNETKQYVTLAEYFKDHPDEEDAYYDDMAELFSDDSFEYPEDYVMEVAKHAN